MTWERARLKFGATGMQEVDRILSSALSAARAFLADVDRRPVTAIAGYEATEVPDGIGFDAAMSWFLSRHGQGLSGSAGPRYFGYVTGGALTESVAGDWLASAFDQNVSHAHGSMAASLERATADAYGRLLGLGGHQGVFVSGATQANLVALATARQSVYASRGFDIAERGLIAAPPIDVIAGAPHASIGKVLSIIGLGRGAIRQARCLSGRTAVDPTSVEALLRTRSAGGAIVVASAGEVNTGDFDDLEALADLCERHGAWLHVDGAFGAFAHATQSRRSLVRGIERADSITVDLHKWLVPYDCGLVFTRHVAAQRDVFRSSAPYLGESPDPLHLTPENSRRWRALPAWFALASIGTVGIGDLVERCCRHATLLAEGISGTRGVVLLDQPRFNVVCFALEGADDTERDAFLSRLAADGRVFMTQTHLFGRPAIRAAVSNWRTTSDDVDLAIAAVRRAISRT